MALAHPQQDYQPAPDEIQHAEKVRGVFDKLYQMAGAPEHVGKPAQVVPRAWYAPTPPPRPFVPAALKVVSGVERSCPREPGEDG